MFTFFLIIIGIIILLFILTLRPTDVIGQSQHYFDRQHLSSMELFGCIEQKIRDRQIPGVEFKRIRPFDFGPFSTQREYLAVKGRSHIFHIGASPYGTDYFVSVWLRGKDDNLIRKGYNRLLRAIGLQELVPYLFRRTYYSVDTENMFKGCVNRCVIEALDELQDQKGVRRLTESEMRWVDNPKLTFKVS